MLVKIIIFLIVLIQNVTAIQCSPGYTCIDGDNGVSWVMKNDGNTNGPNCDQICQSALCVTGNSGKFYVCDPTQKLPNNYSQFKGVADALGFNCTTGGCWNGVAPGDGIMVVSIKGNTTKSCYYPTSGNFKCGNDPGNANCFGERYNLICPCVSKPLEIACSWSSPTYNPTNPTWSTTSNTSMTSCLDRINYWRKRACEEGWKECPPCGLPPITECVGCQACVNSQAEYDSKNGAHKSFTRCGEFVQGEGGGSSCARVIDAFQSERTNGTCTGHCGPIVSHGCTAFSYGRGQTNTFYTLNWGKCNHPKCDAYCANPTSNQCFLLPGQNITTFGNTTNTTRTNSVTNSSLSLLIILLIFLLIQ